MVFIPNHKFNTNVVLTSGMGFDEYGEFTFAGSALVSGTGYLKNTDALTLTDGSLFTVTRVELFTSPAVMTPSAGDKIEVTSGPAISSGTTYRVSSARAVVDVDGFHACDVALLTETDI